MSLACDRSRACATGVVIKNVSLAPRFRSGVHYMLSIIQAPRCGTTACCTHLRLDAEWGSHCDGKYVSAQILGTYIIS